MSRRVRPHRVYLVATIVLAKVAAADAETPMGHPLLPGVRSSEVHETAWPRTLHDNLATGFSPLQCGMENAPQIWGKVDLGGRADWVHVLSAEGTEDRALVYDGRLRCVTATGEVLWEAATGGNIVFYGNLAHEDRATNAIVLSAGRNLIVLDADTGATNWHHAFDPPHAQVRARVDDILPELPGLEAAVVLSHAEDGCVINFPPDGEPTFVWQGSVVVPGEYNERYDHYCDLRLDLSDSQRPLIWNVRRYRCRGFDARTGKMVSSLAYDIGGEQRRNYGPWALGTGANGQPMVFVVGERVQEHVHGIQLNRHGDSTLAWQHYYGEVYKKSFGVAVENLAIADLDGDGVTEVAYSVRDPAHDFRSFVRIRDGATGEIEWERADYWGVTACTELGTDQTAVIAVCPSPEGAMRKRGQLEIYQLIAEGEGRHLATVRDAQLAGTGTLSVKGRQYLMVKETAAQPPSISLYDLDRGKLKQVQRTTADVLVTDPIAAVMRTGQDFAEARFLSHSDSGRLVCTDWFGKTHWQLGLQGGPLAAMSAADVDRDGRDELVAITPSRGVRVVSFDHRGHSTLHAEFPYAARWASHSPLLYDLRGDGSWCLIAPATADDGRLEVCAYALTEMLWKTTLDVQANDLIAFVAHAGQFLPNGRAAVAVSVRDQRLTHEGTYLLDGETGNQLWFKGLYKNGPITMPYRAHGVPTAFDFDGDGDEEIGIDMLSYMAYLRGEDGSFAYVCHSPNIRADGAIYAGHLYNTFCPVYRTAADNEPHWFVKGGFGPFGLMNPDVVSGVWRVDHDYDVPPAIGMIDVDADGELEVGYAAINSPKFVCRDLWTGHVEWELALPHAPNAPCISADFDGDGKGEFLIGAFCIGTSQQGVGELRWQSPVATGWAAIADFDGDGQGEIACARRGEVVILNE